MTGSKKNWQKYLGLDDKTARSIWIELKLKAPTDWWRAKSFQDKYLLLIQHGSYANLAEHIGVSEGFLRNDFGLTRWPGNSKLEDGQISEDELLDMFEKFGSVKLVARMLEATEAAVRKAVGKMDIDVTSLLNYSFGGNSNAKGRRAELDFAKIRGLHIMEDLNLTKGSQAEFDFLDAELGRVNVKSSRRYKYKASTRRDSPFFWKISTRGVDKCDVLACMCYSDDMKVLEGVTFLPVDKINLNLYTFNLKQEHLVKV